jgi:ABC-type transport system substrate-binding protein
VQSWWCPKAKLPTNAEVITLIDAVDPASLRDEFEFGDVSLACTNPCSDSYAEYRCDYELWDCENGVFLYLACNVTYSDFFADGKLRKILTYAIDRDTIVKENYNGLAQAATLPASPSFPYYNDALAARFTYDPMRFIDGLLEVNIPVDEETHQRKQMRLLVNIDDSARLRTARELAEHLTELGLDCGTLEYGSTTNPTYQTVLTANNWDICLGQTQLSANMDLSGFFAPWGSLYMNGITNADIQALNLMALENSGNYYNLHQKVAEYGSVIPVLFGNYAVYAHRGTLTSLSPSRDNVFCYSLGKTTEGVKLDTIYE